MKRSLIFIIVFFEVFLSAISLHAQINENIWFDGLSRSYFVRDAVDKTTIDDTLSARNRSNGYSLLDLNTRVNPIKDIEIFCQWIGFIDNFYPYQHLVFPEFDYQQQYLLS